MQDDQYNGLHKLLHIVINMLHWEFIEGFLSEACLLFGNRHFGCVTFQGVRHGWHDGWMVGMANGYVYGTVPTWQDDCIWTFVSGFDFFS